MIKMEKLKKVINERKCTKSGGLWWKVGTWGGYKRGGGGQSETRGCANK